MIKFFNVLGIITIFSGIISGFYFEHQISEVAELIGVESGFHWTVASIYWIGGTIWGLLFIAFSKCYERLENLEWQVRDVSKTVEKTYKIIKNGLEQVSTTNKKEFNLHDFISHNITSSNTPD